MCGGADAPYAFLTRDSYPGLVSSAGLVNPESERVSGPALGLVRHYQPPEDRWDEMVVRGGAVRRAWAGLASTLEELGSEAVRKRKQALAEELRLNGVTYNV